MKIEKLHKTLWQSGFLAWKCHSGQLEIYKQIRSLDPRIQEALVFCARRFGKSTLGVIMALEDCIRNPYSQVRIIGPTIKQTISIVEPIIRRLTRDAPPGLIHRIKSEYRWYVSKSELIVGGFDGMNITRHLGQESVSIYLEESGAARPEDYEYAVTEVLTPQLLHTRGRKVHLTTPPTQLDHPLITKVMEATKEKSAFFHYTVFQNPLLTDDQIEDAVRESGGATTAAFKRNYLCELVKDENSLVVPQFEPSIHVFEEPLTFYNQELTIVGDLGGVRDKTALFFCSRHSGVTYIHSELIYPTLTESKKMFLDIYKRAKEMQIKLSDVFYIDAPHAMTIDFWHNYKQIVNVPKKRKFDEMISTLRQVFYRQEIKIHSSCTFLIQSLTYGNLTTNHKDFERTNFLGHCDAIAGLAYATWSLQESIHDNIEANRQQNGGFDDKLMQALKEQRRKERQRFDLAMSGQTQLQKLFGGKKV
ncbi:MAG: hypothetical protein OQJ78_05810 [Ignavibacteriaceae bacterium]|nr:hypothetical protein [Ignavibacteriaceae bacterium]